MLIKEQKQENFMSKQIIFKSGLKKDSLEKPDLTLIPPEPLIEVAKRFAYGAKKYGKNNWKKGKKDEIHIFQGAAFRHLLKWIHEEKPEENHAAALITDVIMYEYLKNNK